MVEQSSLFFLVAIVTAILATVPQFLRGVALYRRRSLFVCSSCGNCCRFRVTPLSLDDVKRLESAGLRDFMEVHRGERCMRRVNGRCMFLKDDRCGVYEQRPNVCRSFPFFKDFGIGYAQKASFCPALEDLENGRSD